MPSRGTAQSGEKTAGPSATALCQHRHRGTLVSSLGWLRLTTYSSLSTEAPIDAGVAAGDTRNMLTELLLK